MIFELCRYISEHIRVNKSDLKQFGRSSLKQALASKHVVMNADASYSLTDKGKRYLEDYKVDNAIILAASYGSRFIPFTYDTPHGLLEVRGEVLVERQIKKLKAAGINDIILVVGYLAEQFEYLEDKYDLKLVYNRNFSDDYDLSSLRLIKGELKNSYIITSDIYLGDQVIHQYENHSWYGALFNRVLSDAYMPVIDETGRFVGIKERREGHRWILKGPIFFRENLSQKVQSIFTEDIQDFEMFFAKLLESEEMSLEPFKAHEVFRLDTIEALRAFDRTYLSPGKHETLDLITHVFKIKQDEIYDIQSMDKGMTNSSFLFTVRNRRYVLRVPGKGTSELISREKEAHVYEVIDNLDIADQLVYINPDNGYKISRYYEGVRTLDKDNLEEIEGAMSILRDLHQAQLEVDHEFNLFEQIDNYTKIIERNDVGYYKKTQEVLDNFAVIKEHLSQIDRPHCLCHIDSVPENFLILPDKSQRLIDWEYAGMADPLLDIAMFSIYSYYNQKQIDALLKIYLQREATKIEQFRYYSYIALAGYLWGLWTRYKEDVGAYFGDYGQTQHDYAVIYSKKALEVIADAK
ncbi:MAG TPA: phosphotransferase [Erysipelothrix sp.]